MVVSSLWYSLGGQPHYSNVAVNVRMSLLIPGEQCQAGLRDGEPLEDVDKFKYLGSMHIANDQDTEEIWWSLTAK